jgi:hypothetical protein
MGKPGASVVGSLKAGIGHRLSGFGKNRPRSTLGHWQQVEMSSRNNSEMSSRAKRGIVVFDSGRNDDGGSKNQQHADRSSTYGKDRAEQRFGKGTTSVVP